MGHGHHIEIKQETFSMPAKAKNLTLIVMVIGLVLSGIGIATIDHNTNGFVAVSGHHDAHATEAKHEGDHAAESAKHEAHEGHEASSAEATHEEHGNVETEAFGPRVTYTSQDKPWATRIWANLLVAGYFFTMVSLCGLFWYAIQYAANAGWSSSLKRVPEAIYTFIPVPFVVLLIAVFMGKNDIYHWAHYEHLHLGPNDAGYDKILAGKSGFLNTPMLFILPSVLVAIWVFLGSRLRALSLAEDSAPKGDTTNFRKSIRLSATFLVIFGFTISIVAWLFIMSVDAHWYSTIFGIYNFATSWVSAISVIAVTVLYLKSQGYLGLVNKEHQHDLGKFMFAFTVFWAYIWLFQYLLIWYAHIPEEMMYYQPRFENHKTMFLANFFINFAMPFLFLLMRSAKRNSNILVVIGVMLVIGHYFDVWFMVFPGVFGNGITIGLLEVGMFLTFAGLFAFWILNNLQKRGLVAINHPYLEESVYHDTGV